MTHPKYRKVASIMREHREGTSPRGVDRPDEPEPEVREITSSPEPPVIPTSDIQ